MKHCLSVVNWDLANGQLLSAIGVVDRNLRVCSNYEESYRRSAGSVFV